MDSINKLVLLSLLGLVTSTTTDTTGTTGTGTTGTGTTGTGTTGTGTSDFTSGTTDFTIGTTFPETTATDTTAATTTAANSATLKNQKVKIGKKVFKCNFYLVFTDDVVDVESSTVSCKGKSGKPGKVTLKTAEGYIFNAVVKPPKEIVSLTGGDTFEAEYKNISTESKRVYSPHCGGYNGELEGRQFRGYTTTNVKLWKNAEVDYAFVSTGDSYGKKYGFYTDKNIGYTEAEMKIILKSMKRIEEKTCIRFKRRKPEKGKPWLLVMKEAQGTTCYKTYLANTLANKEIGTLGKIFNIDWSGQCFSGAFVDGLGSDTPVRMVVSAIGALQDTEGSIGLLVHEILHALGVGHTQKRPDRDNYITVNWNNIYENAKGQYYKCTGNTCQTHKTDYDCSSIMHYSWDDFANGNGKTMTAKDANKCTLSRYNTKLTASDITLLKKMYCDSKNSNKNLVTSPNYPKDYSANQDKTTPIKVSDGYVIEITFTDFILEAKTDCSADWVQVVDDDGTELLKKSCGTTKPAKITSKSNSVKVKFHSDANYNYKGFRAEWKAVKKVTPVDGKWSDWGAWSTCSNGKDGKTQCSKYRYRYCNNPAKSNGGKDCEGSSTEKEACKATDMTDATKHPNCVITGGWTAWGAGSKCNSECKTTKKRTCTNPTPINSKTCDGKKLETTTCTGGDCASSGTGAIKSPNYPSNYPDGKDQKYQLKVETGSRIQLTFLDFTLEDDASCGYDYVQVMDTDGSQLWKKCGSKKPGPVISTGNTMTVNFHSDGSVNAKGFSATWKKVSTSDSGIIKSPNYPKSYPSNSDKTYSLSVADGSKIKLTFTDFELEDYNCAYDYVEVFDTNGKSIKKVCGNTKPSPITSTGNKMTIKFKSDYYYNLKGFSATWKKV